MVSIYNALIDGSIVKEDHWKLASGKHSKLYVSKDMITTNPILYPLIISRLSMLIREKFPVNGFDIVTGPAVAGINFSAPVSLNLGKISVYPEKTWLDLGADIVEDYEMTFRSAFQKVLKGKKVVLIEDVITTAGSIIKTFHSIKKCGGEVVAIFCIWNRDPERNKFIRSLKKHSGMYMTTNERIGEDLTPIYSLVEKEVESWYPEECPLCKEGIPLRDPKTDKVIES